MLKVFCGRSVPGAVRVLAPRCSVLLETIRGRKSRNDPKAKSKEGRIKYPPPIDPVEMLVIRERYSEYDLIMKALRLEFKEDMLRKRYEEETGSMAEERARQEDEEHRALMAFNDAENQRMLKLRLERVQREKEAEELRKKKATIRREQELQDFIKAKELEVLTLQEAAKNFITLENLDQRIEEALDNPKNYNFAIDKEGRVVKQTVLK